MECPVWSGYEDLSKRDFVALLWELKGDGSAPVHENEDAIYGCLNFECADALKSGLVANQFILMFVILGLAFLNMFSIGLASHTLKFDIHYKSTLHNILMFFALIAIITGGILVIILTKFHVLAVDS